MVGSSDRGEPATVVLAPAEPAAGQTVAPRRGEVVGRFIILETIGMGGMGVVLSAYDPKLDRKVALKLLRPDVTPTEGVAAARARLLREARAMAKLRHQNVVAVFEVGEHDGSVFLAMEYVAGGTLRTWAAARRKERGGWRQIVAAFVQAGRGLIAAHAEGLVHRDFKPGNVLVEGDRFQVTDFGIASIDGHELRPTEAQNRPAQPNDNDNDNDNDATRSHAQAVVGTAPYMAPELFKGGSANKASDQFAFCVALFEALYGRRPFTGDTPEGVSQSIASGHVALPKEGPEVPQWVRSAVLRGLSTQPSARWPSMGDLIDVLDAREDTEVGRRTRVVMAAAIGVCFVGLPFVAKTLGPPFDRSTYAGVVGQTLALIACLVVMAYSARGLVIATPINRKAFAGALAVLVMQLPLELGNAILGVSVVASDIQHLVLWTAMAAMFAVTVDRRFFALAGSYFASFLLALWWPTHHLLVLGVANAAFIAFVVMVWRGASSPAR